MKETREIRIEKINSFILEERQAELVRLAENTDFPVAECKVNTHLHTFYSFNIENASPTMLAYTAKKNGFSVAGTVDFDVLDALEEFAAACRLLNLRYCSAIESRVFVPEMADKEINSPGEPGIAYFMGCGFVSVPNETSPAGKMLKSMRDSAEQRNREMLLRLKDVLSPLTIDYEKDVLSLTPAGNATERHIVAALVEKAQAIFPADKDLARYWARTLGIIFEEAEKLIKDPVKHRNTIRTKLMKKGGVGYIQPTSKKFPDIHEVIAAIRATGALPCWAWLDGTTSGETDPDELCAFAAAQGCEAVSIIPERNWNIKDAALKEKKVDNFNKFVAAARKHHLLFTVGTEMNNYGQPFCDNFTSPEMAVHKNVFIKDAFALYGHTLLAGITGMGMLSNWAEKTFKGDKNARNEFYSVIGERAVPVSAAIEKIRAVNINMAPEEIINLL